MTILILWGQLVKKLCFVVLMNMLSLSWLMAGGCVSWPSSSFQPTPNAQGRIAPDTGIYWYNTNLDNTGAQESIAPACRTNNPLKKTACLRNLKNTGYFDPSKPTIIFIHGWQPNATANKERFDLCYRYPISSTEMSPVYNTLAYWKGWNVGTFYWTQFADEPDVLDAEAKIYSAQGKQGMRWSYLDDKGQLQYCDVASLHCVMPLNLSGEVADILDMLEKAYRQALPSPADYHGSELRIAGQSLGTQLAIQLTHHVLTQVNLPQPTRLSLMDPYFSPNLIETKNEQLPISIADYNSKLIRFIKTITHDQFPIDVYRTSTLSYAPTGNPGDHLMNQVAYMSLYPKYFDQYLPEMQKEALLHISSIYLYFESKKHSPINPTDPEDSNYVNAAASNAEVLALMGDQRYQKPSDAETNFTDTQDAIFGSQESVKQTPFTPRDSLAAILALPIA